MINIKYSNDTIRKKRKAVGTELIKKSANIKSGTITSISVLDLRILYENYDRIFFRDWFKNNFKGQILYELSRRMTKNAGTTKSPRDIRCLKPEQIRITICIGIDFFFRFDYLDGRKTVGGIEADHSLEALQIVFEHELLHVIELVLFHRSSCRGQRFRSAAKNIFGHTQSHHQIPTNHEIAREKFGINIGDEVRFIFDGKNLDGIVSNIKKRATVMVADPNGIFSDKNGTRYKKYYVPIRILSK